MTTAPTTTRLSLNTDEGRTPLSLVLGCALLGGLLISNLPLFVAMPLTSDTVLYDMQARNLLEGGVQYREIFEINLPGVVWMHMAIRSLFGWSSEAMRLVDIVLFAGCVLLLARWVRSASTSSSLSIWTALFLFWFYFSISEWSHCQRDTWMLLPALGGLFLRRRQIQRMTNGEASNRSIAAWACLEGTLWATAVWIKPFVVFPALVCWVIGLMQTRRWKVCAIDFLGLLISGLIVGGLGIGWMIATDAWTGFIDTFSEWNPRYFAAGRQRWTAERFYFMLQRFHPWLYIHIVAFPLAVMRLVQGLRWERDRNPIATSLLSPQPRALLAGFYLAWLLQSIFLQFPLDYIHVPAVLLAITLITSAYPSRWRGTVWKPALATFVWITILSSPVLRFDRLACWWPSLTQGSTAEIRDRLTDVRFPHFQELQPVVEFLRQENLRDGELTCYNVHLIHLYTTLDLKPSTRYIGLSAMIRVFPEQHAEFHRALSESRQRYVVTELIESGMDEEQATAVGPRGPSAPPPAYPRNVRNAFPWSHPVVFRSGRYLVHRVDGELGRLDITLEELMHRSSESEPLEPLAQFSRNAD